MHTVSSNEVPLLPVFFGVCRNEREKESERVTLHTNQSRMNSNITCIFKLLLYGYV